MWLSMCVCPLSLPLSLPTLSFTVFFFLFTFNFPFISTKRLKLVFTSCHSTNTQHIVQCDNMHDNKSRFVTHAADASFFYSGPSTYIAFQSLTNRYSWLHTGAWINVHSYHRTSACDRHWRGTVYILSLSLLVNFIIFSFSSAGWQAWLPALFLHMPVFC